MNEALDLDNIDLRMDNRSIIPKSNSSGSVLSNFSAGKVKESDFKPKQHALG